MATIEEVYNLAPDQMIFDVLDQYNPKWSGVYNNTQLNLLYLNHSGSRNVSPLITRMLKGDAVLSSEARDWIGSLLNIMYMKNWDYVWEALLGNYNPLENYSMLEDETTSDTREETNATTSNNTTNNTETITGTTTSRTEDTSDNLDKVYAYDSEVAKNDSSSNSSSNTSSNSSNNESTENTGTNNTTSNSTSNSNNTATRKMNRHGNIGVKSSQQLIREEIELRKFKFFDIVFRDIDELLCSHIVSIG